jgi:hypothetical protein
LKLINCCLKFSSKKGQLSGAKLSSGKNDPDISIDVYVLYFPWLLGFPRLFSERFVIKAIFTFGKVYCDYALGLCLAYLALAILGQHKTDGNISICVA